MSTIRVDNLQTTGGVGLYPAKAWVNFACIGTVSINASGNVSSLVDNGTGNYTVSMGNAMSTTTYGYAFSGRSNLTAHLMTDVSQRVNTNNTTSSIFLGCGENGGNNSSGRYNDPHTVSGIMTQ